MPFKDESEFGRGKLGEMYMERVYAKFVQSGKFHVAESGAARRVMEETKSGDAPDPVQIGRLLGADFVVTGVLRSLGVRVVSANDVKSQIAEARVTLTVVRVDSGRAVFSDEGTAEASRTASGGVKMSYDQTLPGSAVQVAAEKLADDCLKSFD